jgi:hypothetical protein
MHIKEKELERAFDAKVNELAQKYNYQQIPWLNLTKLVLLVYFVLTIFSMFYRPDFMSITAVSIGGYILINTSGSRRSDFRLLVLFLFISFVYDLIFLIFLHDSEADDELDSHMADNVRRFAYFFAWLSFAFRPAVILVLWKVSLHFRSIVRQKNGGAESADGQFGSSNDLRSDELQLAKIMNDYSAHI